MSNSTDESTSTPKDFKAPNFKEDLVLYFHPYNFYSQKVCDLKENRLSQSHSLSEYFVIM